MISAIVQFANIEMILLPVIERELRAAARHSFTYHLRVLGVLALLVAFVMCGLDGGFGPNIGGRLFSYLHGALFFAIWILGPLLAADAISRERREGTLPLLFLTPLKPEDIVRAKGMIHGLRAFTLWLAVLPVLTICFVAGGVGWAEILISVLVNFSSVCLVLAAGLVATAGTKRWTRALAVAFCLAFVFLLAFFSALPFILAAVAETVTGNPFEYFELSPGMGFALALNWEGVWQDWLSGLRSGPAPLVWAYASVALLSFFSLFLAVRLAAWRVRRTWREEPPSARVLWLRNKLVKPVLGQNLLRRWLRWELQRNPIGWLERRSWSGRLVVWSWFAFVVCIYSSVFANLSLYQRGFHALQTLLASLLAGSMALSAAGSFRRERESGVLELLLIAPMREWQIIAGRVRGLWGQFIPAVVLLCVVWLYGATFLASSHEFPYVLLYLITFATVPVVGLYFSLAKTNFVAALLWTLLVVALPGALASIVSLLLDSPGAPNAPDELALTELILPASLRVFVALFLAWRLHANLKRRKFALEARIIN